MAKADTGAAALHIFTESCEMMKLLYTSIGAQAFLSLNTSLRWSAKVITAITWTVPCHPDKMKQSGAYLESAITRQVTILQELISFLSNDRKIAATVHRTLANLLRDPDDLDSFDYHYQMAFNAAPGWGNGYLNWSEEFECSNSTKVRQHAIEILERGLEQPSFHEGGEIRIKLLERLIYRCTKEKRESDAEKYADYLHELRPIVPVPSNLKIRKTGPWPCGSGNKKYKNCCGLQGNSHPPGAVAECSVQDQPIGNFKRELSMAMAFPHNPFPPI